MKHKKSLWRIRNRPYMLINTYRLVVSIQNKVYSHLLTKSDPQALLKSHEQQQQPNTNPYEILIKQNM